MNQRNFRFFLISALAIVVINVFVLVSQLNLGAWGQQASLDFSKDFANQIVSNMQSLAKTLGIEEKTNVKQALAKLHYDVYLMNDQAGLAGLMQNNASEARSLIISEYVKTNGEQVLMILNNAPEVQRTSSRVLLNLEPLPEGGFTVRTPHNLSENTISELAKVSTLFNLEYFHNHFVNYRSISTLQIEVQEGKAQLAATHTDQDTIKYWEKEILVLRNEYERISKMAGFAEISGPGVTITIYDKLFSVSAVDLRKIVGELFSAGASAISVAGHRLAVNSYIVDTDEGINIDGFIISSNPVVIEALGDHQTIISGIDLLFSVDMKNMFYVTTDIHDRLVLPAQISQ